MGQTLTHGVYLPDEGERNCYDGLAANWQLLDGAVGTVADHTAQIAGKAPAVHTHTKSDVTDLLNSNFIPSANNSYDLGSSSYQWNNVYSKGYYYNGTPWGLDKENTWTKKQEINTGSDTTGIYFGSYHGQEEYNTCGTSNYKNYNCFLKRNSNRYDNTIGIYRSVGRLGDTEAGATLHDIDTSFAYYDIHIAAKYMQIMQNTQFINNDTVNQVIPSVTNTTDLGTSNNKWKTLNGVNPGALSLPGEYSSSVTEYITDKTGGNNAYTAPADGWVGIQASSVTLDSANFIFMGRVSDGPNYYTQNASSPINGYWSNSYHGCIILPVIGGKTYGIRCKCDSVNAKFYKANGNVS